MVSNKLYRGTAFAVGCIAFASSGGLFDRTADGALLTVTLTGYSAGRYELAGYNSALSWNSTASVSLSQVRAQQHVFTEASGVQNLTWCAEIYQGVDLGQTYTFNISAAESTPGGPVAPGPMGAAKAGAVRDLFARWINPTTGYVNGGTADRDAKSAAFQVVLWEITHENFTATTSAGILSQLSLSSGAFRASVTGATAAWYNQIVASLGSGGFQAVAIQGLTSPTAQDQIMLTPVPAPGALALLGLAGLAKRRRR
jgi:hypothetical protein